LIFNFYNNNLQYLVFDIETSPINFDNLSHSQQEYWLRGASTDEEKDKKKFEMGLNPYTAQVVCIGLQLMEINEIGESSMIKKAAFSCDNSFQDEEHIEKDLEDGSKCYISSEKKLLNDFWKILHKYNTSHLVSFNGRGFDSPFLMLRSAVNEIRPSRDLMQGTKFNYGRHIDLLDELTYYSGGSTGPTRRLNFDFFAHSFGIKSPKSEGVDGSMVGDLFAKGEHLIIAEYCLRDVSATWELFLVWNKYLRFKN
jgi:DNA polymerase elongation subunit (family B)